MVGGWIIDIWRGKEKVRLWCADRHGDECCVYVEPFEEHLGPDIGEEIWWQCGKVFYNDDHSFVRKIGYSFKPPATERSNER
jgi:hypothetical protein